MRGSVRPAVGLLWGVTVAVAAAASVFLVLGPGRPLPEDLFGGVSGAAFLVLSLSYATVGALIASRLPAHRVGWLFSVIGLLIALNGLSYSYATHGLYATDGGVPGLTAAVLGWGQVTAPLMALSLLLFPDGKAPVARLAPGPRPHWPSRSWGSWSPPRCGRDRSTSRSSVLSTRSAWRGCGTR